MTISKRYASVESLRARLDIDDTIDDKILGSVLDGISGAIDHATEDRYYTTSSDETRYFTAQFSDVLWPGHINSLTTIQTDADGDRTYEDTWTSDDYDLCPYNAALDRDTPPYSSIEVTPDGDYSFPEGVAKGTKLTGKWGWTSVPSQIEEATLLLGEKLFKRKDAIFGVMGVSELGIVDRIIKEDPEIALLLAPFMALVPRIG